MNFFTNVLKHASQSVVSGLVGAIGSFAASIIIARLLGVEGTATVAMALWLVFLTTTLADLGISGTLARFAAECPHDDEEAAARLIAGYMIRLFLLAIAGGLVLTAGILWFYWNDILAKYASGPGQAYAFCALVLVCFVIHMLYAFAYQFLRGIRAFRSITLYSLIGTVLQIGGAVGGSLLYGANGGFVGYIVFSVPMILGLSKVRWVGRVAPPAEAPAIRRYAASFYLASLFSPLLWVRADTLIVDQMVGAEAVGLFTAAGTIAALLLQICMMICNALLPNIVHAAANQSTDFAEASRSAVRLALSLLLPACLIAAVAAPEAVTALYGQAFAGGRLAASILCLAGLGSALTLAVGSVLNAGDHNSTLARNGIIGAVLTIACGVALAAYLGLVGAALGRLIAQGIVGLLNARSANRKVPGLVTWGWMTRIMLAGGVGALVTEALGWWLGEGLAILLLSLAAGGVAYLVAAALLLPLGEDQRARLRPGAARLPAPLRGMAAWLLRPASGQ
ncbi:hypothetical protein GCM10022281_05280 [Sphingomonas rosea]|uniref:Polysaccharide biosynthesis protein n=1 Tax=Sphingomonas rosea TaxID=335605 RepID=A0ABP7TPP2_9SPHN